MYLRGLFALLVMRSLVGDCFLVSVVGDGHDRLGLARGSL